MTTHNCRGKFISNSNGADFDCLYNVPFSCEECYFNKLPHGKKPWAKKYQSK